MRNMICAVLLAAALPGPLRLCAGDEPAPAAAPSPRPPAVGGEEERLKLAQKLRSPFSRASVNRLLDLLRDPAPEVRAQAALSLGEQGHEKAFNPLLRALAKDPSAQVREAAAAALGRLQDVHADAALDKAAKDDPSEAVKAAALVSLGELRDSPELIPAFAHALRDRSAPLRAAAARALGSESGYHAARLLVGEMLSDPDENVRADAAEAAGRCCARPLRTVRLKAGYAPSDPSTFDPLWDPMPFEKVSLRLGKSTMPEWELVSTALVSVLASDKSPAVRAAAARGLARSGSSAALEPLLAALRHDVDGEVRAAAAMGLGDLRAAAAEPALRTALEDSDPDVRMDAETALDLLGALPQPAASPAAGAGY